MIRNRIPLLLSLFLALSCSLSAAQVYVMFDQACMDRLEFDMNSPNGKGTYLVYHVNIRSGEKLVLDVGEESSREQNYMPEPYLSCNSGGFDQGLMRRVNANIDQVYVVFPKGPKRFIISRVVTASYYNKAGSVISYESPKYRFRFDTEFGTIGENIAVNNPGAKVYFEGKLENDCTGSFLFRQLSPQSAYPLIDLVVTPEIGIIEERSGANAAAAMNNSISIRRINDRPAERYLQEVCGTEPGSQGAVVGTARGAIPSPANYNISPGNTNPPPGNLPPGAIVPSGNVVARTPAAASNTGSFSRPITTGQTTTTPQEAASMHTVAKGETLYGISRKYEVSVEEIKDWNNLSTNIIRRGQVLQVAAPNPDTATSIVSRGTPSNATTLSGNPVPYNRTDNGRIITDPSDHLHIVAPGETVASIALQYGYTSKRYREINELGPNDYVKVGQRLKTTDCDCATSSPGTTTNSSMGSTVPRNFNSTGGRLAPNDLAARTPTVPGQQRIMTDNSGAIVRGSGGLPTYSRPTVPAANTARGGTDYSNDAVLPSGYDASGSRRSISSFEGNNARAIGSGNDFGNPVITNRGASPSNLTSPYPPPNNPISYNNVVPSRPDNYYNSNSNRDNNSSQRRVHVVAGGESLYGISRRYGLSTEKLRQLNNLGPNDPIIEYQTLYLE